MKKFTVVYFFTITATVIFKKLQKISIQFEKSEFNTVSYSATADWVIRSVRTTNTINHSQNRVKQITINFHYV